MSRKKPQKKETRRSKQPHPDSDPRYNLKTRADLLDQDYLNKLSPKEMDWLNKFNREYVGASLDSENPKRNLHKSKRMRKDCYDRNNSRNRDVLTRAKASSQTVNYDDLIEEIDHSHNENNIIEKIDQEEIIKSIEWLAEELNIDDSEDLEDSIINEINLKDKVKP